MHEAKVVDFGGFARLLASETTPEGHPAVSPPLDARRSMAPRSGGGGGGGGEFEFYSSHSAPGPWPCEGVISMAKVLKGLGICEDVSSLSDDLGSLAKLDLYLGTMTLEGGPASNALAASLYVNFIDCDNAPPSGVHLDKLKLILGVILAHAERDIEDFEDLMNASNLRDFAQGAVRAEEDVRFGEFLKEPDLASDKRKTPGRSDRAGDRSRVATSFCELARLSALQAPSASGAEEGSHPGSN